MSLKSRGAVLAENEGPGPSQALRRAGGAQRRHQPRLSSMVQGHAKLTVGSRDVGKSEKGRDAGEEAPYVACVKGLFRKIEYRGAALAPSPELQAGSSR